MSLTRLFAAAAFLFSGLLAALTPTAAADLPQARPLPTLASMPASFYVHLGAAGMFYAESARMSVAGTRLPGASVSIDDVPSFALEAGYFVTPNIAVSATIGFPPLSKIEGSGTLDGLGRLGKVVGGPASLSAHYHLREFGAFQPYLGGGVAALVVFDDKDGALQNLKVRNAAGPMVQAGFDLMLNERWGVFFDVKKAWIETKAKGLFAGAPIVAKVALDPLVVHSGVTLRF